MVGEMRCLSCARHLADVVRSTSGKLYLDHPAGQADRPIMIERRDGLRCTRCGGRALLEWVMGMEMRERQQRTAA